LSQNKQIRVLFLSIQALIVASSLVSNDAVVTVIEGKYPEDQGLRINFEDHLLEVVDVFKYMGFVVGLMKQILIQGRGESQRKLEDGLLM
jgi:hypothetical protein